MRKAGIATKVVIIALVIIPVSLFSQTYWNLEPIWIKAEPESTNFFGVTMASGDIDGNRVWGQAKK